MHGNGTSGIPTDGQGGTCPRFTGIHCQTLDEARQTIETLRDRLRSVERFEAGLRRSQARYARAMQCSPDAIVIVRLDDDRVADVNERLCQLFDAPREDIVGRQAGELGLWPGESDARRSVGALRQTGSLEGDLCLPMGGSGQARPFRVIARLVEIEGQLCGVLYLRDESARRHLQDTVGRLHDKLRHSQAGLDRARSELEQARRDLRGLEARASELQGRHEALLAAIPGPVAIKDRHGAFMEVNQAWADHWGLTRDKARGMTDADLCPAPQAEYFEAIDRTVMLTGRPLINRQEGYRAPDGQYRWVLTSKTPIRDAAGKVSGLVSTMLDVSDLHPCPPGQYVSDAPPSPAGLAASLRSAVSSILTNAEVAARLAGDQGGLLGRLERIRTDALRAGARLEEATDRFDPPADQADLLAETRAAATEVGDALPDLVDIRVDAQDTHAAVPLGASFLRGVVRDLILWACGDCREPRRVEMRLRLEQRPDADAACVLSVRPDDGVLCLPGRPDEPHAHGQRNPAASPRSAEMLQTLRAIVLARGGDLQWPPDIDAPEVRLVVPAAPYTPDNGQ